MHPPGVASTFPLRWVKSRGFQTQAQGPDVAAGKSLHGPRPVTGPPRTSTTGAVLVRQEKGVLLTAGFISVLVLAGILES